MRISNAMMILVCHKDWTSAKNILVETNINDDERLDDIAKKAFERYKKEINEDNIAFVSYVYYGDIDILLQ